VELGPVAWAVGPQARLLKPAPPEFAPPVSGGSKLLSLFARKHEAAPAFVTISCGAAISPSVKSPAAEINDVDVCKRCRTAFLSLVDFLFEHVVFEVIFFSSRYVRFALLLYCNLQTG
jgi:hypothetical protein